MKAVIINSYGGRDVMNVSDILEPSPVQGQVLVKVRAAGLNPVDWKIRAGFMKEMAPLAFPITMGGDIAGIVEEIGEGVTGLAVGDEVFGSALVLMGGSGGLAEYAVTSAEHLAKKPASADMPTAAALPLAGSSAAQALMGHMTLSPGQKVLIHGGAGGIGHLAIQIAKALGAYVGTTVGTEDIAFVSALGADEVVDYKTEKFEEKLKEFDAVYDLVGGETTSKSFSVLKEGGVLVSMAGAPDAEQAKAHGVTAIGQFTNVSTEHLDALRDFIDKSGIRVTLAATLSLDDAQDAFALLEEQHPRGKVVLVVGQ